MELNTYAAKPIYVSTNFNVFFACICNYIYRLETDIIPQYIKCVIIMDYSNTDKFMYALIE